MPTADKEELAAIDQQADAMTKLNEQLQTEVNQLTARHRKLVSNMTFEEAKAKLKEVHSQVGYRWSVG